jgi:hypothetical protein
LAISILRNNSCGFIGTTKFKFNNALGDVSLNDLALVLSAIKHKYTRKLPQNENNMKIEASISLRRRDEEVKVHGEPDCCNLG